MIQLATDMLSSTKQRSCMSLLLKLTQTSRSVTVRGTPSRAISIDSKPKPLAVIYGEPQPFYSITANRTPVANIFSTSPENGYFRGPAARTRQASRWREDWEELEVLVSNTVVYEATIFTSVFRVRAGLVLWSRRGIRLTVGSMLVRSSL